MTTIKVAVDQEAFQRIMHGMRKAIQMPAGTVNAGDFLEFQIADAAGGAPLDMPYITCRVTDVQHVALAQLCGDTENSDVMALVSFNNGLAM